MGARRTEHEEGIKKDRKEEKEIRSLHKNTQIIRLGKKFPSPLHYGLVHYKTQFCEKMQVEICKALKNKYFNCRRLLFEGLILIPVARNQDVRAAF